MLTEMFECEKAISRGQNVCLLDNLIENISKLEKTNLNQVLIKNNLNNIGFKVFKGVNHIAIKF
jgi:hypothetical protein